jgi:hypothetical protein
MTPEQIADVSALLDREYLSEVTRRGPEPVFATISGAHLYGFASPDSDVDLRGAFVHPARDVLGLHPPNETITIEETHRIDLDWVAHDVRRVLTPAWLQMALRPGTFERPDQQGNPRMESFCCAVERGPRGSAGGP